MTPQYTLRRKVILEKAAKLLAQRGYFGVSMQDIADVSNISKSTLYHHFKSKDDLVEELLRTSVAELKRELKLAVEQSEFPPDILFNFTKTFLDFKVRHPEISLLSMTISSDESVPVLKVIEDLQLEVVKVIRELVSGIDLVRHTATKTAISITTMIAGILMSPFHFGTRTPEQAADDLTAFFFQDPDAHSDQKETKKK